MTKLLTSFQNDNILKYFAAVSPIYITSKTVHKFKKDSLAYIFVYVEWP